MAENHEAEGAGTGAARMSRAAWLLPAVAFVAGVVLGAAVMAVGNAGDDDGFGADPSPTAAAGEPSGEPAPRSSDLNVRVPAACLAAADDAEQVARAVDDVVRAAGELDARRLQELVDRFQQLQPEIEQEAQECRDAASQDLQDGTLVTPAPLVSPS